MAAPLLVADARMPGVASAVARAARRTGTDFGFLLNQARLESDLNPNARAPTSSATGLFQFTEQTWLRTLKTHGAAHGLDWAAAAITPDAAGRMTIADAGLRSAILDLRLDAETASAMAGALAQSNGATLEAGLGRPAEPVDLYLAHFLGAEGSLRFLRAYAEDPSQPAAPLFPAAAAANRSVFYSDEGAPISLAAIRARFATKLGQPSDTAPLAPPAPPATAISTQLGLRDAVLRDIEPMPGRLSLGFAEAAYQRLAQLGPAA